MQAPQTPGPRRTLFVIFLLSFVPYLFPPDKQPAFYHDVIVVEESTIEHRRIRKILGDGDLGKMGDFFDSPQETHIASAKGTKGIKRQYSKTSSLRNQPLETQRWFLP